MGLIDFLDKVFFCGEDVNRCKSGSQTYNSSSKKDANPDYIKEYDKGIFKWTKKISDEGYLIWSKKTAEATIEKMLLTEDETFLFLSTSKGEGKVEIPLKFKNPEILKQAKIRYTREVHRGGEETIGSTNYELEILDGPFKGTIFREYIDDNNVPFGKLALRYD